jgi:hypothetical protein
MFRFYHADRRGQLVENTELQLPQSGLSPFGQVYWNDINTHQDNPSQLSKAAQRESIVEEIRKANYPHAVSRFQCFFGANHVEDAVRFAKLIEPVPEHSIGIFEVFATAFVTLDMNHIDVDPSDPDYIQYVHWYWRRVISNHGPPSGNRRAPNLEVLMQFPVRIGRRVMEVNPNAGA